MSVAETVTGIIIWTMAEFPIKQVRASFPALQDDSRILQRATYMLWIAHKLERAADHCSNICERIVFIVEGEKSIQPSREH